VSVRRILHLKRRPPDKGLILVAADLAQVRDWIDCSDVDLGPILSGWPGPVTWVFPAQKSAPALITGSRRSIAVRISAHPVVRALCAAAGPLVSTSANPSGQPPARSPLRVRAYFPRGIDYVFPGRVGRAAAPSEIRDARTGAVLREGG
jgi:L-threonylcarbamoyladenylate synthase